MAAPGAPWGGHAGNLDWAATKAGAAGFRGKTLLDLIRREPLKILSFIQPSGGNMSTETPTKASTAYTSRHYTAEEAKAAAVTASKSGGPHSAHKRGPSFYVYPAASAPAKMQALGVATAGKWADPAPAKPAE